MLESDLSTNIFGVLQDRPVITKIFGVLQDRPVSTKIIQINNYTIEWDAIRVPCHVIVR